MFEIPYVIPPYFGAISSVLALHPGTKAKNNAFYIETSLKKCFYFIYLSVVCIFPRKCILEKIRINLIKKIDCFKISSTFTVVPIDVYCVLSYLVTQLHQNLTYYICKTTQLQIAMLFINLIKIVLKHMC